MSGTAPKDQSALQWDAAPARVTPQPGERLWTLHRDGASVAAVLRYHGEPYGVELQLLRDGAFSYGRRGPTREFALEEAAALRKELEAEGWTDAG